MAERSDDGGPPTAPARPVDLPVPVSAGPVSSGTVRAHRAGRRTARVSHQPRPRPQARARTPGRLGRGLTIGAALGLWVTSFVGGAVIGALTRAVDLTPTPHADHPAEVSEGSPATTDRPEAAVPVAAGGPAHPGAATPATTVQPSDAGGRGGHGGPGPGTGSRGQNGGTRNGNGHGHGRSAAPAAPTTTTTSSTTTTSAPTTTTTGPPGDGGNGGGSGGNAGNGDDAVVTPLPIERPIGG